MTLQKVVSLAKRAQKVYNQCAACFTHNRCKLLGNAPKVGRVVRELAKAVTYQSLLMTNMM